MDRRKTKLSNQDIKYFQSIDAQFDPDGLYWGFVLFSMQEYAKERLRDFCDEVVYGIYNRNGGCYLEMKMIWVEVQNEIYPKLIAFSQSIPLLGSPTHIQLVEKMNELPELFTPMGFVQVLTSMKFHDDSDHVLPPLEPEKRSDE